MLVLLLCTMGNVWYSASAGITGRRLSRNPVTRDGMRGIDQN